MGSQSEPQLCLPWGLLTAGKADPVRLIFIRESEKSTPAGKTSWAPYMSLTREQGACSQGGSGCSSHCGSDSPEVPYTASESDLWSGAIIRKQIQVRRMGHATCKVPATLKPAAEASFGQGVFGASFISLEQALVGTFDKLWKALTSEAQKPYCRRDQDWERNEAKATQLQKGMFLEDRRWAAFSGSSEPCGRLWGSLEAGVSPHSTPTLPWPLQWDWDSVFLCSVAFCTDPPSFSKMIWLGQQKCQWGRLDGSLPYSGQKIIRTWTSWVLPFQALCPDRHYRFKLDQRPGFQLSFL